VARPCDCDGPCLGGRYGAYSVLVHLAQADTDPARHQLAMHAIAQAAPHAGGDNAGADAIARSALARIYPDEAPQPSPETQDTIKQIEAAAIKRFEQLLGELRHNAGLGRAETSQNT
jgi:hypothetical protein